MSQFAIGATVYRQEDRGETRAEVLAIDDAGNDVFYLIAYDEGGEGWWPEAALSDSRAAAHS